jgi:hypothetical protein
MKLEFSQQIFEKYSNMKFHEILSSGNRVIPCERTDRHGEASSRCSQLYESACQSVRCWSRQCNEAGSTE